MVGSPEAEMIRFPLRTPDVMIPSVMTFVSYMKSGERDKRAAAEVKSFMFDAETKRFLSLYWKSGLPVFTDSMAIPILPDWKALFVSICVRYFWSFATSTDSSLALSRYGDTQRKAIDIAIAKIVRMFLVLVADCMSVVCKKAPVVLAPPRMDASREALLQVFDPLLFCYEKDFLFR